MSVDKYIGEDEIASFESGNTIRGLVTDLAYEVGIESPDDEDELRDEKLTFQGRWDDGTLIYFHSGLGRFFVAEPPEPETDE